MFPRQLCCVQHREGRCSLQSVSSADIFPAAREEEQEQSAVIAISHGLLYSEWSFGLGNTALGFVCTRSVYIVIRVFLPHFFSYLI